jgi:hypothetical protein
MKDMTHVLQVIILDKDQIIQMKKQLVDLQE